VCATRDAEDRNKEGTKAYWLQPSKSHGDHDLRTTKRVGIPIHLRLYGIGLVRITTYSSCSQASRINAVGSGGRRNTDTDPWRESEYVSKLTQQFKDGHLNAQSPLGSASTLEELGKALGSARRQTREMREQGPLRETTRQMIDRVLGRS
jgi:hypothetical protein